jgi:hypothetical protein
MRANRPQASIKNDANKASQRPAIALPLKADSAKKPAKDQLLLGWNKPKTVIPITPQGRSHGVVFTNQKACDFDALRECQRTFKTNPKACNFDFRNGNQRPQWSFQSKLIMHKFWQQVCSIT